MSKVVDLTEYVIARRDREWLGALKSFDLLPQCFECSEVVPSAVAETLMKRLLEMSETALVAVMNQAGMADDEIREAAEILKGSGASDVN